MTCPYNHQVDCETQMCHCCGWHPYVAEQRLKAIKVKLGIIVDSIPDSKQKEKF